MMVLVDTSVWSLALRRKPSNLGARDQAHSEALRELVREGRVQIVGPVRQELLSGIRDGSKLSQGTGRLAGLRRTLSFKPRTTKKRPA